ncbi:hypothetical protein ACFLT7_08380 [candidate division KSB1 bacterium]
MSFWDDVQKEITKGVDLLKKRAGILAVKTEETASLARLRYSLYGRRSEVSKRFAELGRRLYELAGKGSSRILSDSKIKDLLEEVKEYEKQIAELEKEIEGMKNPPK